MESYFPAMFVSLAQKKAFLTIELKNGLILSGNLESIDPKSNLALSNL